MELLNCACCNLSQADASPSRESPSITIKPENKYDVHAELDKASRGIFMMNIHGNSSYGPY